MKKAEEKKYIKEAARKLPVDKCWLNPDWKEEGMAQAVVTRKKRSGKYVVGVYLLDTFCLGLKDTIYFGDYQEFELEELIERINEGGMKLDEADPLFVQNLIYGAVEYAEDLSFSPAKDFEITEFILDPVDEIEVVDIEFGKDGKPFYIAGPHDNIDAVLKKLDKAVGEEGYKFAIPHAQFDEDESDDDFEDDEDIEWEEEEDEKEAGVTTDDIEEIDFEEVKDEKKEA